MKKYLSFIEQPQTGKTKIFNVINVQHDIVLGWVKWYGPWRKYIFQVKYDDSIFDSNCLKEIIEFLDSLTASRKENDKN